MFSQLRRRIPSILRRNTADNTLHRYASNICAQTLQYCKYGEPADVLELVELTASEPKDTQVLVKLLAAPINPSDINTIQGKYPVKLPLPAIAGNEGVAEVLQVGDKVQQLKPGQRVVVVENALGTWRTHAVLEEHQLMCIPNEIDLAAAATLVVNPPTAYRMLKDFVPLTQGDCVIQNGANSAVGQMVHQLCKEWGLKSVGVVRNRPNLEEVKTYLKELGASEILTEEELAKTDIFKKKLPAPRLALNCVGGKNASDITKQLAPMGVMVTYGGMSRQPVMVSTPALIFKNISFCGFWVTRWMRNHVKTPAREKMFADLMKMFQQGKLKGVKCEMVPLKEYKAAVAATLDLKGLVGKKYILDMQC
ncbi:enoyl-[acyl-carrier-protein] reductase, mitochondrial-like [Rhagoletis pomonella]|uniref:enoyl-[acyl-carrier-protein] reductase, mitochondrial-like n=1 Tax=Rhagoletis pomonella TaxID=28610 RepID=UPI00177EFAB2|nr:enoyl-[acyl-carrier-protein] reductase, mitochondrial-like [Rhagoletis pomonella]